MNVRYRRTFVDDERSLSMNLHRQRTFLPDERAPNGGAGAERRLTIVLQLHITTPHYGHLILQMAVYAL